MGIALHRDAWHQDLSPQESHTSPGTQQLLQTAPLCGQLLVHPLSVLLRCGWPTIHSTPALKLHKALSFSPAISHIFLPSNWPSHGLFPPHEFSGSLLWTSPWKGVMMNSHLSGRHERWQQDLHRYLLQTVAPEPLDAVTLGHQTSNFCHLKGPHICPTRVRNSPKTNRSILAANLQVSPCPIRSYSSQLPRRTAAALQPSAANSARTVSGRPVGGRLLVALTHPINPKGISHKSHKQQTGNHTGALLIQHIHWHHQIFTHWRHSDFNYIISH